MTPAPMAAAAEARYRGRVSGPDDTPWLTRALGALVAACAAHPWVTILWVALFTAGGLRALADLPLDAVPDLSDPQVIVFTEWPGRSPDRVEEQVTYPLSTALLGAPAVRTVRGQSMFGMSFVYVIFEDGTDLYWARSRVLERLAQAGDLPEGATPTLGPDASGVGWVYQYALVDRRGTHDLQQLTTLQQTELRYALQAVEGVAEVATVGGMDKELQVHLEPRLLLAHGLSALDVARAVREANADVGGQTLELAGHEHVIRGRGLLGGAQDLSRAVVAVGDDGQPITVGQLGWVGEGPAPRRGIADLDGAGEVVGGIIVMRQGENALRVIERVEARLEALRRGLPDGVEIVTTYDRSGLVRRAIATLTRTLAEELLVVAVIIAVFLLHLRSTLVPVLTLPVAVACAFLPMSALGIGADIMSLGGIAIALGAMVDASIVLVENVHKRLENDPERRHETVVAAMVEVAPSLFFSLLLITVSFLPVFALTGTEGRLFRPLAATKTFSMAFASVLAVTLTPALVVLLVRGRLRREDEHPLNRWLVRMYEPVVRAVVRARVAVMVAAVAAVVATAPAAWRLGSEFMPALNEGSLLFMPTAPPGMGATEATVALQRMDGDLRRIPEVRSVFGKMGRARTPTDPAPLNMAEVTVELHPPERWRPGLTWDALVAELDAAVSIPGMPNLWWMPVQTRTEMLATGVRSPVAVRLSGQDAAKIEAAALAVEQAMARLPGTASAFAERSEGGAYVDVVVDRAAAARYGVTVDTINAVVATAVGGLPVGVLEEGRARYPITVRLARDRRDSLEALEQVPVPTAGGAQVPLRQVAAVSTRSGPPMLRSEGGRLAGFVYLDNGEVPLADYVDRARAAVDALRLEGVDVAFVGQIEHLERAERTLRLVVPVTLGLVVLLLWLNTRSVVETAMVALAMPFSIVGGVWMLTALDLNLSVAVWVGMIALVGLDAETGVVMLLYLSMAVDERRPTTRAELTEAVVDGAARRVRPKLMTVLTTMIGLLPILWSTGTGADVMRPMAAPMVGGLVTSFLLELAVYPAAFALWKGRGLPP